MASHMQSTGDAFEALAKFLSEAYQRKGPISLPKDIVNPFYYLSNPTEPISLKEIHGLIQRKWRSNILRLTPKSFYTIFAILLGCPFSRVQEKLLHGFMSIFLEYKNEDCIAPELARALEQEVSVDKFREGRHFISQKLAHHASLMVMEQKIEVKIRRMAAQILVGLLTVDNTIVEEFQKETWHQLFDIFSSDADFATRFLVADVLREMIWARKENSVDLSDLDVNEVTKSIPGYSKPTSNWIAKVADQICGYGLGGKAYDETKHQVFRLRSLQFEDGSHEDDAGNLLVAISDSITFILLVEDARNISLIEVPFKSAMSVKASNLETKSRRSQPEVQVVFQHANGDRYFRGTKKAIDEFRLILTDDAEVVDFVCLLQTKFKEYDSNDTSEMSAESSSPSLQQPRHSVMWMHMMWSPENDTKAQGEPAEPGSISPEETTYSPVVVENNEAVQLENHFYSAMHGQATELYEKMKNSQQTELCSVQQPKLTPPASNLENQFLADSGSQHESPTFRLSLKDRLGENITLTEFAAEPTEFHAQTMISKLPDSTTITKDDELGSERMSKRAHEAARNSETAAKDKISAQQAYSSKATTLNPGDKQSASTENTRLNIDEIEQREEEHQHNSTSTGRHMRSHIVQLPLCSENRARATGDGRSASSSPTIGAGERPELPIPIPSMPPIVNKKRKGANKYAGPTKKISRSTIKVRSVERPATSYKNPVAEANVHGVGGKSDQDTAVNGPRHSNTKTKVSEEVSFAAKMSNLLSNGEPEHRSTVPRSKTPFGDPKKFVANVNAVKRASPTKRSKKTYSRNTPLRPARTLNLYTDENHEVSELSKSAQTRITNMQRIADKHAHAHETTKVAVTASIVTQAPHEITRIRTSDQGAKVQLGTELISVMDGFDAAPPENEDRSGTKKDHLNTTQTSRTKPQASEHRTRRISLGVCDSIEIPMIRFSKNVLDKQGRLNGAVNDQIRLANESSGENANAVSVQKRHSSEARCMTDGRNSAFPGEISIDSPVRDDGTLAVSASEGGGQAFSVRPRPPKSMNSDEPLAERFSGQKTTSSEDGFKVLNPQDHDHTVQPHRKELKSMSSYLSNGAHEDRSQLQFETKSKDRVSTSVETRRTFEEIAKKSTSAPDLVFPTKPTNDKRTMETVGNRNSAHVSFKNSTPTIFTISNEFEKSAEPYLEGGTTIRDANAPVIPYIKTSKRKIPHNRVVSCEQLMPFNQTESISSLDSKRLMPPPARTKPSRDTTSFMDDRANQRSEENGEMIGRVPNPALKYRLGEGQHHPQPKRIQPSRRDGPSPREQPPASTPITFSVALQKDREKMLQTTKRVPQSRHISANEASPSFEDHEMTLLDASPTSKCNYTVKGKADLVNLGILNVLSEPGLEGISASETSQNSKKAARVEEGLQRQLCQELTDLTDRISIRFNKEEEVASSRSSLYQRRCGRVINDAKERWDFRYQHESRTLQEHLLAEREDVRDAVTQLKTNLARLGSMVPGTHVSSVDEKRENLLHMVNSIAIR